MIYDCFMFNDELDVLKLRLAFLNDTVDFFVLAESRYTHTNKEKPLVFAENRMMFEAYKNKIRYIEVPRFDNPRSAWDVEHFQRNCLKEGLQGCTDDDIIIMSDVDEIVNVAHILSKEKIDAPRLVDMNMYYYYLDNLNTDQAWSMSMIATYQSIKDVDIGDRNLYPSICRGHIRDSEKRNGWHFSYLFGDQVEKYISKVQSFAHQEYNRPYYLIESRIRYCVANQIDLFERRLQFKRVAVEEYLDPKLIDCIRVLGFADQYLLGPRKRRLGVFLESFYDVYYHHGLKDFLLHLYRALKKLVGR